MKSSETSFRNTTLYVVAASVTHDNITRQIPIFYLNARIQGIVSPDHAQKVVEDILNPSHDPDIVVQSTVGTALADIGWVGFDNYVS